MKILFIHRTFPGQFLHLAQRLAHQPDIDVLAIGSETDAKSLPGVRLLTYSHSKPELPDTVVAPRIEDKAMRGLEVLNLLLEIKKQGYQPDIIIGHPCWGETLFIKLAFPAVKLIHFNEQYLRLEKIYNQRFDPEFPPTYVEAASLTCENALRLLSIHDCDLAISPTQWQKSMFPAIYHDKIHVIHEGINTDLLGPDPRAAFLLPNGKKLSAGDPVVTYISRDLEPYRGFHRFMRVLPELLKAHADCQILVVGGDGASYGRPPQDAPNWREKMLQEVSIDPERVHFLGRVDYDVFRRILQISAVHVYMTYPFVLSWSCLEAMASGCLMIGSDTAPVREFIRHGENGWLVDFFDGKTLANQILYALKNPPEAKTMRANAQQSIKAYSIEKGVQGYMQVINKLLGRSAQPASTPRNTYSFGTGQNFYSPGFS